MENKILIVDESEHFVSTIVNRLMNYGYDYIYTASNGVEGTDKIALLNPDVVILDTNLSDMDSFKLCAKIKDTHGENVKVLLMVRMTDEYDPQKADECGADAYVIKTFDCIQLLTEIKRALFVLSNDYSFRNKQADPKKDQPSSNELNKYRF